MFVEVLAVIYPEMNDATSAFLCVVHHTLYLQKETKLPNRINLFFSACNETKD